MCVSVDVRVWWCVSWIARQRQRQSQRSCQWLPPISAILQASCHAAGYPLLVSNVVIPELLLQNASAQMSSTQKEEEEKKMEVCT